MFVLVTVTLFSKRRYFECFCRLNDTNKGRYNIQNVLYAKSCFTELIIIIIYCSEFLLKQFVREYWQACNVYSLFRSLSINFIWERIFFTGITSNVLFSKLVFVSFRWILKKKKKIRLSWKLKHAFKIKISFSLLDKKLYIFNVGYIIYWIYLTQNLDCINENCIINIYYKIKCLILCYFFRKMIGNRLICNRFSWKAKMDIPGNNHVF